VTRILIVDDHPAVRAGLLAVLRGEPGLVPVGTADSAEEALEAACHWAPDVVMADYQLPDVNGAMLTWELKQLPEAPRVVIYSAFAEPRLFLAAALSGAEAVLDKNRSVDAIFETIRGVAAGKSYLEPLPLDAVRNGARLMDPQDQSIFGLAIAGEQAEEIAAVLRLDEHTVRRRLSLMIQGLGPGRTGYEPFKAAS
jgi:DNA-binding NarL/FixJ family response regulator